MTRVLVTGGTGFVGSHLIQKLQARGDRVGLFVQNKEKAAKLKNCEIYEGNIKSYSDVLAAFTAFKPDFVFHAAAALSRSTSEIDEQDATQINQEGTRHIVDSIVHMKNISPVQGAVMCGSSLEYGSSSEPLKEDTVCNPVGSYAISKYHGTVYALKKAEEESLPIISLRIFTPYGPNMNADSFVSKVFARAVGNKDIVLSSTSVTRDFIYIDDLVELSLALLEQAHIYSGQVFNAGSGEATTLYDFITCVIQESGSQSTIVIDETLLSPQDHSLWQADMTKTFEVVDWRPQTDLNTGIGRILAQIP